MSIRPVVDPGRTTRRARLPRSLRAGARRVSWGLADQAVSSLTNLAVGAHVARTLGVAEFGVFGLAWVTYGIMLNLSRGLSTDPLVVRFSGVATDLWRDAVTRSTSTALLAGTVGGTVSALAGVLLGGPVGSAFIALGIVLPGLMLQDSWRFAFFAAGQGQRALVNDCVWAVMLVPAMFIASGVGETVSTLLLAWGVAGAVAAGFGCLQTGVLPRGRVRSWFRQQRDLSLRFMTENLSASGSSMVRMFGLGGVAGLAAVGSVRGVELLLAPVTAAMMGFSVVAVPEAARVLRRSPQRLRQFCLALGGCQAFGALLWGAALLLMSDRIGSFLLGEVWTSAAPLVVPATVSIVGVAFGNGAAAGLRALGAARRSMTTQIVIAGAYVTGGVSGAAIAGAYGSVWGVAIANLCGIAIWWYHLRAALRDHRAASAPTAGAPCPTEDLAPDPTRLR